MSIITTNTTLEKMENIFDKELREVNIIGELDITKESYEWLLTKINSYFQKGYQNYLLKNFRKSLSVFLVFLGVYDYNADYWSQLEKVIGRPVKPNERIQLFNILESVVNEYGLPTFQKERNDGYRNITLALCHAGIPLNNTDFLFDFINNTFYDMHYIEDNLLSDFYLASIHNSIISTKRYISYLGNEANDFFIELRDFIKCFKNNIEVATSKNVIVNRIAKEFINWTVKEGNINNGRYKRRVYFASPRLRLDSNELGIYLYLPEQKVKDSDIYELTWSIVLDGVNYKDYIVDTYEKADEIFTEERIVKIPYFGVCTLRLMNDQSELYQWNIMGINDEQPYLLFDYRGNSINKDRIDSKVILITTNDFMIEANGNDIIEDPNIIRSWANCNGYHVELKETNICIRNQNDNASYIIDSQENTQVKLEGGKTLSKAIFTEKQLDNIYTILPTLKIKKTTMEHQETFIFIKNISSSKDFNLSIRDMEGFNSSDDITIELKEYMAKLGYGDYSIKIVLGRISKSFRLKYLPDFKIIQKESNNTDIRFKCTRVNGFNIEFKECKKIDNSNDKYFDEFYSENNKGFIEGKITSEYFGESIYFIYKFNSIFWGFIGLDESEKLVWDCKVNNISKKDISVYDRDIYFAIGTSDIREKTKLTIKLISRDGINLCEKIIDVYPESFATVNMNQFIPTINNSLDDMKLEVEIWCEDSYLESLHISNILNEIEISHLEGDNIDYHNYCLKWKERGSLTNRQATITNLITPWEKPITLGIEDFQTMIIINERYLNNNKGGIFEFVIGKTNNDFFNFNFESIENLNINHIYKQIFVGEDNSFENQLSKVLYCIYTDIGDDIKIELRRLIERSSLTVNKDQIFFISHAYLSLLKKMETKEYHKLDRYIVYFNTITSRLISNKDDMYEILDILLDLDIPGNELYRLLFLWNINSIGGKVGIYLEERKRNKLWRAAPLFGFIIDMRNKIYQKDWDDFISKFIRWTGEEFDDALSKIEEIFSNQNIIGNYNQWVDFFEYRYKMDYNHQKSNKELLSQYLSETKINSYGDDNYLGISYLDILVEIQDRSEGIVSNNERNIKLLTRLNKTLVEFNDVNDLCSRFYRRTSIDGKNIEYELIGKLLICNCTMANNGRLLEGEYVRKMEELYKNFKMLFIRDLVLVEIYNEVVLKGGEIIAFESD